MLKSLHIFVACPNHFHCDCTIFGYVNTSDEPIKFYRFQKLTPACLLILRKVKSFTIRCRRMRRLSPTILPTKHQCACCTWPISLLEKVRITPWWRSNNSLILLSEQILCCTLKEVILAWRKTRFTAKSCISGRSQTELTNW